jgi:GTP-binding protein
MSIDDSGSGGGAGGLSESAIADDGLDAPFDPSDFVDEFGNADPIPGLDGGDEDEAGSGDAAALPVLAVVGRPNVGKSTLVNRILGRREAVVQDVPGVTRDRVYYEANWAGRRFTVVDTGGWEVDVAGLDARVAEQAEIAVELADAVVFVVDATVGLTDTDEAFVRVLRRARKPVLLAANKVDNLQQEAEASALWSLGLGEPHAVSAMHGRGSGELLDAILEALPEPPAERFGGGPRGPRRVALVGKPNVGKSSLLNKLAGQERVVVDPVAGTTRDPVDELIELGGRTWRFVDTAGIRRRVHQTYGADFYASLRTAAAIEKAEVAVVLIDVSERLAEQDTRIITKAPEAALAGWETRVPTARLNSFLGALVAEHPHPVRGGKQPRILFGTQASSMPPRFVLFASGFLEAGYRRFVERRLREEYGFVGTPIEISVRVREKRGRGKK